MTQKYVIPEKGALEKELFLRGHYPVGIDEVGRGCLAGPVYAAAVRLNYSRLDGLDPKVRDLVRDSKKLSAKQRQRVYPIIESISERIGISFSTVGEIEEMGIVNATFLAMQRAYLQVNSEKDIVLIDGNQKNPFLQIEQRSIIGGDNLCFAIAAASILAKECRDKVMREASEAFPDYGFEAHVGYGTKCHLMALEKHGITPLHRRNFAPVSRLVESNINT